MHVKEFGDAMEAGAIVDKVYLDLDSPWGFEAMQIAHEMLLEKNIIHRINASGRWGGVKKVLDMEKSHGDHLVLKIVKIDASYGFHVYFWIVPDIENKKSALLNTQKNFCDELVKRLHNGYGVDVIEKKYKIVDGGKVEIDEFSLDENQIYYPVDKQVWGDILRISRVPNTWNPKRGRFCIPLTDELIDSSANEIQEMAKKQLFLPIDKIYFGQRMMKVPKEFDVKIDFTDFNFKEVPEDYNPDDDAVKKMKLPPCIKTLVDDKYLINDKRFWLLVYLRESGISMEEAASFFLRNFDPQYAYDSIYTEKQPQRVYRGKQRQIPMKDCQFMSKMCSCLDQCPKCHRYSKRHPVYRRE